MRRSALLTIACLLIAAPAASAGCSWSAKLHATTHHPKAGAKWPIRVTTSLSGVRTSAYYAFIFGGRQVSKQNINPKSSAPGKKLFHFTNGFRDPTVVWPRRSANIPLTFRVVLKNRCGTKHLDYKVTVHT